MIICPSCGSPIPNNAKFCKDCGATVPDNVRFCANCHSDIPEGSKFCTNCGTKLTEDNYKSISAMLIIFIVVGAGLVFYRSLDLPQGNLLKKPNSTIKRTLGENYMEESFHTLIFKGKTTHQAVLNIYTPTTQALILEDLQDWVTKNRNEGKIKDADVTEISVFEKDLKSGSAIDRLRAVYVDLEANPDYEFSDYKYSNFGENLYIHWKVN